MLAGAHQYTLMERVVYGQPVAEVLPDEVRRTGAQRVFVISTASLAASAELARIEASLGERHAGTFTGVRAHSPREGIIEGAVAAEAAGADLLLGVGGGSVIDAAKVMLLVMRHGYTQPAQLDPHADDYAPASAQRPADHAQWRRMIAIPTTFSAAEYRSVGGATDTRTRAKQGFANPMMTPVAVINDPAMTCTAPVSLLLSTGMKAVDHAVERITSRMANLHSDTVSALTLRLLARGLPALKQRPDDLAVRAELQYALFILLGGLAASARSNLSHAIAHALGSLCEVPHGHTSCVLLPATLSWLGDDLGERRRTICEAMGRPGHDAAGAVSDLVARLDLPVRLRDVGVRQQDLPLIAERTLDDPLTANCVRKVDRAEQVREVLDLAW